MKQPYKVQNRTSESRRVKFVKNGGTVSFPKTPTASFVENSREAGFCLTAISPLPPRENATKTITLTTHPMGTDGRVSLFINDTLIESKRFVNKSRIVDRQAWFNREFGAYATYSGKEVATFTTALVSPDTYRFVFEDDDLDYVFAGTTNAAGDVNPTLIVEQYRLAFNIMNNKIEISCDGATYESPYMSLTGDWQLEINGEKYTTADTPIEEMLAMIAQSDVSVVYEGQEPEPEPTEEVITDFSLAGWYNPELQRFEGFIRPTEKFLGMIATTTGGQIDVTADIVQDGKGRWHYSRSVTDVAMFGIATYRGEMTDPDNLEIGEQLMITDFTLSDYRKADADIIPTYGKELVADGDVHLYFKIGNGELQKEQIPLANIFTWGESVNLNMVLASFADKYGLDGNVGPLGNFFMTYTNTLGLLGVFSEVVNPTVVNPTFADFKFLTPHPDRITLDEPVTVTLYRGLSKGSTDLFNVLFPNVAENYITFTATAKVDPRAFLLGTPVIAATNGEVLQFCKGPFGNSIRVINASDIDQLTSKDIATKDFLPRTGYINTDVDYSTFYSWNMSYSESGNQLAVAVGGSIGGGGGPIGPGDGLSALFGFERPAPGTFELFAFTEEGDRSNSYPTIEEGVLGWHNWSTYRLYRPNPSGGYEYTNDWGFGNQIVQMYEVGPNEQFVLVNYWDGSQGSGFKVHHLVYDPIDQSFNATDSGVAFIPNQTYQGTGQARPSIVNLTDETSLITIVGKLVVLKKAPVGGNTSFTILEDTNNTRCLVEVGRNESEVFMVITEDTTRSYRFVAMNVTDYSMRPLSAGSLDIIGGLYGARVGKGKTVFYDTDSYTTKLTFSEMDTETGVIRSTVFQPK